MVSMVHSHMEEEFSMAELIPRQCGIGEKKQGLESDRFRFSIPALLLTSSLLSSCATMRKLISRSLSLFTNELRVIRLTKRV